MMIPPLSSCKTWDSQNRWVLFLTILRTTFLLPSNSYEPGPKDVENLVFYSHYLQRSGADFWRLTTGRYRDRSQLNGARILGC